MYYYLRDDPVGTYEDFNLETEVFNNLTKLNQFKIF